jgi:hypothetical protein
MQARFAAIAVGVVAAALMIGVAFTREVLVDDISSGGTRCGLDACTSCSGAECISQRPLVLAAEIRSTGGEASSAWGHAGLVAWDAALVSAGGIVLALLMVVTRKHVRLPLLSMTLIVLGGATAGFAAKSVFDDAETVKWVAAIVALAGLLLGVAILVTGRIVRYALAPTTIALLGAVAAMVAGCIFVATRPEMGMARIGLGFWAYAVGILATGFAAVMLSRQLHLIEPEFDPGESLPEDEAPGWDDELR